MISLTSTAFLSRSPARTKMPLTAWKIAAAALLAAIALSASASAQSAQWVKQMGQGGISNGVSSDVAGNAYATGIVSNLALFDNISIPCNTSDVFLTKYDSLGNIQWATVGGGPLLDQANDLTTDPSGNSYVVGAIQTNLPNPTAKFGNFILTGNGDFDWLIVKYDPAGNVLWAKNYGSTAGDIANGVALDATGNVYVVGYYSGTMKVQGVTLTSKGLFDIFLAKLDANGTLLWLKSAGGEGQDIAHKVVVDGQGNVGLAGEFQKTAFFGSRTVKAAGLGDAFIAKYDAAGNSLWVHSGGGPNSSIIDPARAISVDGANNFYVTGDYTNTGTFDGLSVPNTGTSGSDIFVAKYNSAGAIQWLHHGGGVTSDKGYSIGVDTAGNSWVSGFAASGPGVVFDTIALPPLGNEYIFLAKYDPSGTVQYVKQYAAGSGQAIHVLGNGCLYLNGGASKGNGNEFDNISLVYTDRNGFICQFCETPISTCQPPLGVAAVRIFSTSASISWIAVPDAAGYLVQYRILGATQWRTKRTTKTHVKLSKLTPATSYEYQVATLCGMEASPYSTTQVFTTTN